MGSLRLDCCVDWLFTPEAEAPPKRRATLIPRAPALGCLHRTFPHAGHPAIPLRDHTYSSFFSVFPGAIRSRRAEKIDSTPKRSLHGAAWRSTALQRPVWTRRDEEDSASSRADLPREESDIERANERETECNEE